ncbi:GreA/GreB family elongation factor [Actinomycetospora soli]|uniref:GreA/GreB family elongation factor n=1 Tax=Actinomycetospora soli TaxID=2893887 RepID=UPI001E45E485|nr:GreA/GreB family elongation factor [Actinomycetospora soli]MCD2191391.1 GreA/GreB family elongation factor [Actinomycetospora soli]
MTTNGRAWLSPYGCELLRDELDRLLLIHRADTGPEDDTDAWARRRWRERRIRHLQELLLTADIGNAPPDDGVVEAGMVLTVRFGDAPDDETFLLADGDVPASANVEVYSSASPIGSALLGAREGESRLCRLPGDRTLSVTVRRVRPYGRPMSPTD